MAECNIVTLDATPRPLKVDLSATAALVVDMQNDFGAVGGMFDRAGIDISVIRRAIAPTVKVIAVARAVGLPVIYVKEEQPADGRWGGVNSP